MFPPLRGQTRTLSNLPTTSRSFVGRTKDRQRLAEEVLPGRVVTLTGVGGVGKTRLAVTVGADLSDRFPDGVWWCDMASIEDSAGVVPSVAAVVSARLNADRTPTEAVIDVLRGQQALIIVDNCEHLLAETSQFLDAATRACRTVAFLATSREPLAIEDERVWPLRSVDPEGEGLTLFVDRAAASDPTFDASSDRPPVEALTGIEPWWRRLIGPMASSRTRNAQYWIGSPSSEERSACPQCWRCAATKSFRVRISPTSSPRLSIGLSSRWNARPPSRASGYSRRYGSTARCTSLRAINSTPGGTAISTTT